MRLAFTYCAHTHTHRTNATPLPCTRVSRRRPPGQHGPSCGSGVWPASVHSTCWRRRTRAVFTAPPARSARPSARHVVPHGRIGRLRSRVEPGRRGIFVQEAIQRRGSRQCRVPAQASGHSPVHHQGSRDNSGFGRSQAGGDGGRARLHRLGPR
jgi:hypothetical protein